MSGANYVYTNCRSIFLFYLLCFSFLFSESFHTQPYIHIISFRKQHLHDDHSHALHFVSDRSPDFSSQPVPKRGTSRSRWLDSWLSEKHT